MSEVQLDDAEGRLAVKFPPAFRLMWSLHDGQQLQSRRGASRAQKFMFGEALPDEDVRHSQYLGLLGGEVLHAASVKRDSTCSLRLRGNADTGATGCCPLWGSLLYAHTSTAA